MKKRLTSIIICLLLIALQLFSTGRVVLAENELEIATQVTGMVTSINNQPFVPPLGVYAIQYQITNTHDSEITDIQIQEVGPGSTLSTPVDLTGKTTLGPGKTLIQVGNAFDGDANYNPNAVQYKIQYTLADGTKKVVEDYVYVHVIEAGFAVTYTASTQGPIFKGEQVTLKAQIESLSNVTLYNLVVTDKDMETEIGTIAVLQPGGKAVVEKTLSMERTTLGNLSITYDDPMGLGNRFPQHVKTNLEIQVKDEAPVSSLNITGKTDMSKIPGPTSVDFELTVKNTGNTALTELKCLDWDGKEFHTQAALQPGEEITVTHTATVKPDENYELLVQARVENSNQLIKSTWSTSLAKLDPKVEITRSLSVDRIESGVPFVLEYTLRNTGNVNLINVKISESHFGDITDIGILAVGQEVKFDRELELDETASSKTILTAVDAETEKEYSYEASEMEFTVAEPHEEIPKQALSIILQTENENLNKPGSLEMECIVRNTGQETLNNLVFTLMDRDMNIGHVSTLEPGAEKKIQIPALRITKTETFVVEANGLGEDQQKFTAKSEPLTVTVSESGLSGTFSIIRVVLIVIILVCIVIIGVLVYTLKGSPRFFLRRKKKSNRGSNT